MKKTTIILLGLIFSICFAEDITLENILNEAMQNSKDVKSIEYKYLNNTEDRIVDYLNLGPSLNINTSRNFEKAKSGNFSIGLNRSLSLTDSPIFNFYENSYSRKIASLEYERDMQNFLYNIVLDYISILDLQRQIEILEANVNLKELNHKRIEVLYSNKQISSFEFKQSQLSLLDTKISLQESKLNLENAKKDFFVKYSISEKDGNFSNFDFEFYQEIPKFEDNLDIDINNLEYKRQKISHFRTKLSMLPTVSLTGLYTWRSSASKEWLDSWDLTELDEYHSYGINLSYSIFDVPSLIYSYKKSKRNLKLNLMQIDFEKNDLKNQYVNLVNSFNTKKEIYQLYKEKKDLAIEQFDLAKDKYELGMLSLLDFEQAKIDKLNAELDVNSKYYSLMKTQVQLSKLLNIKSNYRGKK